jgi:DNA-binding transcriptional ArsR family regulator
MSPRHRVPPGGPDLDPLLLDPTRLSIMSLLTAAGWCEFGFIRDSAGLTDPALSKQAAALSKADYVEVRKGYVGKRPRTWLRASAQGRDRVTRHIQGLQAVVSQAQAAATEYEPEETPDGT